MKFMDIAIEESKKAYKKGEVPIGAVIVRGGRVIARAHNRRERKQNALAHAEILAIHKACKKLKSWRLDDCVMYVTLEPCIMCAGAILNARIPRVVIGAKQGKESVDVFASNNLNHKAEVEFDLREECSEIIKKFFAEKR